MAQSGYTPLKLYRSSTASNVPLAANLADGELAINTADGKLYYKDSGGTVQLLASKAATTNVASISFGSTGLTPSTATTGAVTVAGTLITSNGGTGLTSYTAGDLLYYSTGTALSKLGIGSTGQILTVVAGAPAWATAPATGVTSVTGTSPVVSSGGSTPAISLASGYGDTLNPYASKTANYVLAAPNGSAGAPGFRALVAADIPTLNQNTTGSAGSVANALTAGTGITFSSGTTYNGSAAITISIGQAVATSSNVQFNSVGVGTAGSGTAGEIRATNNVTAYYSDERFKTKLGNIDNALDKLKTLDGFYYEANELAQSFGYEVKREVGVSAQQVQAIMPEVVAPAPIDENYLTVRYERLVPLLIEAIKELTAKVEHLEATQPRHIG